MDHESMIMMNNCIALFLIMAMRALGSNYRTRSIAKHMPIKLPIYSCISFVLLYGPSVGA